MLTSSLVEHCPKLLGVSLLSLYIFYFSLTFFTSHSLTYILETVNMKFQNIATVLSAASLAVAQRPASTPICDYYTTALLKNNTAENQYTLLTLLVNTAVIGNYTKPNVGVTVPGILAKGTYNGTAVNLLPYFDGELASSNRGGSSGVSVNFLDGGAATPLMMNMPANSTTSNQYKLLTHLYQYFGALLGCSEYGMGAFPAYQGFVSRMVSQYYSAFI